MARGALPGPDPARWLDGAGRPALAAEQVALRRQRRHQRHPPGGRPGQAGPAAPHEGQPVRGRIRVDTDKDAQPTLLSFDAGKGQLSIIRRGPRDALRVKHADAPARRDFAGLEYWPGGPDWQVQARFIAHPPGKTLPIVDITGLTTEMPNAGAVDRCS
ncbi:hypothetical protein G6F31_018751 [Rhizopus arrhizus]|nr:hypothetical protein G6F31_018751 [Rhizopus arrhizus]